MVDENVERVVVAGGWWDIKKFLTRGDRKQINRIERSWVTRRTDISPEEAAKNPRAALTFDPQVANTDERDDLMLRLGTVGSSFFEEFSPEVVDELNDEIVDPVLERMTQLYLKKELEQLADLKKA